MKNTQKGFVVPLLIIIIAVLVIGGGSYIYNQNKKVEVSENNSLTATTSTATNLANLKAYSNNQNNFSFQYSSQFVVQHQDDNSIDLANNNTCVSARINQSPGDFTKGCQYISVRAQNNPITGGGTKSSLQIDNIKGEQIITIDEPYFSVLGQIENNNKWYVITVTSNLKDKSVSSTLFSQIVSSFKLTK